MSYNKAHCKRFEYIVTTSPAPDWDLEAAEFAAAHRGACPKCAAFESEMTRLEGVLRAIPAVATGDSFVSAVMAGVRQTDPRAVGLWERMFGVLPQHSYRRGLALTSAAAVFVMLAVGGVAIRGRDAAPPPKAPAVTTVAELPAGAAYDDVRDILQRHQSAAMSQPLSDDAGVRLVALSNVDE